MGIKPRGKRGRSLPYRRVFVKVSEKAKFEVCTEMETAFFEDFAIPKISDEPGFWYIKKKVNKAKAAMLSSTNIKGEINCLIPKLIS